MNFTGNFLVLTGAAFLYITCCIGLGLVISVLCRTQIAAMLITFVSLMPPMLFSGEAWFCSTRWPRFMCLP